MCICRLHYSIEFEYIIYKTFVFCTQKRIEYKWSNYYMPPVPFWFVSCRCLLSMCSEYGLYVIISCCCCYTYYCLCQIKCLDFIYCFNGHSNSHVWTKNMFVPAYLFFLVSGQNCTNYICFEFWNQKWNTKSNIQYLFQILMKSKLASCRYLFEQRTELYTKYKDNYLPFLWS